MIKPTIPNNETERLAMLKKYSLMDTLSEQEFDQITFLASQICGTPISLISLIDEKRQWFKSKVGLDAPETSKDIAFCAHAINDPEEIFIIPDSRKDERFFDNPLVTAAPYVIFYAGIPLVTEGYPLGTLCVIDNKPHELNENQLKALQILSNQVVKLFELRIKKMQMEQLLYEIEQQNKGLQSFAHVAAHDIRSPLANLVMLTELLKTHLKGDINADGLVLLEHMNLSSRNLINMVNGILDYSKNANSLSKERENVNIEEVIHSLFSFVVKKHSSVKYQIINEQKIKDVFLNRLAIERILINLIDNAIKYNESKNPIITISLRIEEDFLIVDVKDNGIGITKENHQKIFKLFEMVEKSSQLGTGIGLASVKSLVEGLGGKITLTSQIGEGSNFQFSIKL